MNKIIIAIMLILTSIGAYIGVASLGKLSAYDTVLVGYTSRINALQEQIYRLQEEDRVLNAALDLQNKRLTDQDNLIRLQNAQIAELRARVFKPNRK